LVELRILLMLVWIMRPSHTVLSQAYVFFHALQVL